MTRSIRIHEFGGAGVLHLEEVAVEAPANGGVRLPVHDGTIPTIPHGDR